MEVVDNMHAGQSQGVGRMSEDPGVLPECVVIHTSSCQGKTKPLSVD